MPGLRRETPSDQTRGATATLFEFCYLLWGNAFLAFDMNKRFFNTLS
jgi:hypothetical protein